MSIAISIPSWGAFGATLMVLLPSMNMTIPLESL
jgi:hypothetical protein